MKGVHRGYDLAQGIGHTERQSGVPQARGKGLQFAILPSVSRTEPNKAVAGIRLRQELSAASKTALSTALSDFAKASL